MAIIPQKQLFRWEEIEAANGFGVDGDVGHGVGPRERKAEGQDQKPRAGCLIPAERDTVAFNSVYLSVPSIGVSKSGLIEPIMDL